MRVIVFVLAALLVAAPAAARPRPKKADPAATAFKEGQRLRDLREWDAAIVKFKRAYELRGDAASLRGIAQTYQLKGDCSEALGFFETYRKQFPADKDIAAVDAAIAEVEACAKDQAAKLEAAKQAEAEQAAKEQAAKEQAEEEEAAKAQAATVQVPAPTMITAPAEVAPATTLPDGSTPAEARDGAWSRLVSGGKISFYGMLRVDTHYTDSAMNDARFPMWALSTGNSSFIQGEPRTELNKNPTFVMHPRLSRLGLDATSKPIEGFGNPTLSGKLEFDFFAGENESRALPRLRHVYGKLSWGAVFLLFGQTTDVLSPLLPSVNAEATMWNAGNLGDRQPQIQLGLKPNFGRFGLELQVAAGQEGARTNADLDGDGNLDGDLAARPQLQGRFGIVIRHWVDEQPVAIGAWGVRGSQRLVLQSTLPLSVSPKSTFNTVAVGGDFTIPLLSFLKLQGEVWQGRNLADLRGGIGQLIDIRTGTEVRSRGGWAELLLQPVSFWRIAAGAGTDTPNEEDVQQRGQRSLNRVLWLGNMFTLGSFSVGMDYSRWHTEWVRVKTGLANRYSLSLIFTF